MRSLLAHWRQFAVYISGGVLCALIDIGLMQLLIHAGAHFASATTAGFVAGLLVNYLFHTRITFASDATPANLVRYLCVVAVNYLLTMACVALSVQVLDAALPGKLLSLPLVALSGFVLGKYWIYK